MSPRRQATAELVACLKDQQDQRQERIWQEACKQASLGTSIRSLSPNPMRPGGQSHSTAPPGERLIPATGVDRFTSLGMNHANHADGDDASWTKAHPAQLVPSSEGNKVRSPGANVRMRSFPQATLEARKLDLSGAAVPTP
eukprot:gene30645-35660_t